MRPFKNHSWNVLLACYFLFSLHLSFSQSLQVSENKRYLVYEDGSPFFYLGDTAWELFHRLSEVEADHYLSNRAEKGFTVIQAVILAQLGGITESNANGDLPLIDKDPSKPNEAYFAHVDAIVNRAEELGLFIGMLPSWGSYWQSVREGEKIFTVENARQFGLFLGARYKEKPIIWILGGDENINNSEERAIVESLVEGLKEGDGGEHLMTFHPRGPGLSSDYWHEAEWLDFNMYQSSHGGHDHDNGFYAEHDYQLSPTKPTLDGEPRYELIQAGFYFDGFNRMDVFTDDDTRQAAYWSILAGACGHTYGHNCIWQMWSPEHRSILNASIPWNEAMDHPGAYQMRYVKELFDKRPFHKLVPSKSLVLQGPETLGGKLRAAVADDQSFAIIYSPRGEAFTVDQSLIQAEELKAIWYDPRYGVAYPLHSGNTFGIQTYTPPTQGKGHDWILILEDAKREFPLPGMQEP